MVKSNKLFKTLAIIITILCIVGIAGVVKADPPITITAGTITGDSKEKVGNITGQILGGIQIVGFAIGVVIIGYMGIKYITASPDGKAEIKKQAAVYVLGAAFVMLAPTIATMVFNAIGS